MRLIDADTLQFVPKGTKYVVGVRGNGKPLLNLVAAVQEAIDKTPTIDAVPVVRCKECKHSTTFHHTGNMYCGLHENHHFLTDAYGFCHKGERRCDNDTEKGMRTLPGGSTMPMQGKNQPRKTKLPSVLAHSSASILIISHFYSSEWG